MSRMVSGILLATLFAAAVLVACSAPPTATPIPPTAAPPPTQAPPTVAPVPPTPTPDSEWDRVKATGKLIVGTSADYPPFAYYTSDFKLDGFDVALIRMIGQELGLPVEIKDFAFDGLAGALQLNQIDVAIGAISVTPQREAVVNFTNPYYVGEDAALGRVGANIEAIQSANEVGRLRVGVQRGSVYESWAEQNLIKAGQMPEKNLFSYVDIGQAVRDLNKGLIDVVLLDAKPAEDFVQQGGVEILTQGLSRQLYAMAVRQGAFSLQAELNRALQTLQDDGQIAELVQQYLQLDSGDVAPLPTPAPVTPTPEPPQPTPAPEVCIDGLAWVADLNYDDKNMTAPPVLQPGQPFQKGWRVRNSGTCTWDLTYSLGYVQGNSTYSQMQGQPVRVTQLVPPGAQYDIYVNLVAPPVPGVYQGFWQMRNGVGTPFGQRVYVGIQVPAPPAPTPAPTQTPAPGVTFYVDRTNINAGECVTFYWNVQNVQAVYFYAQGQPWEQHGVAGQASQTECPQTTTTYELRVVYPDGRIEIKPITIYVQPAAGPPKITYFTTNPADQAVVGQCVDLQWAVEGDISWITVAANSNVLWDGAPVQGSVQDCPSGAGTVAYTLVARGPGGESRAQRNLNVYESVQPVPY